MKGQILTMLLLVMFLVSACGDDTGDEPLEAQKMQTVEDSIPTIEGRFLYLANAAVIKGDSFIYGVTIDSLALELAEKVRPYQEESFDMVPVKVKARIVRNPGTEGWDEFIELQEILEAPAEKAALREKASEEE